MRNWEEMKWGLRVFSLVIINVWVKVLGRKEGGNGECMLGFSERNESES